MAVMSANLGVLESAAEQIVKASEDALAVANKLDVSIATAKASGTLSDKGIADGIELLQSRLAKNAEQLNLEGKKLVAIAAAYRAVEKKVVAGATSK